MPSPLRIFVEPTLYAGAEIAATAAQAHYLGRVMRRAPGDPVHLFNGRDGEWSARLGFLRRDEARFTVEECLRAQVAADGPWLAFALLKRDATDLVVQKATELGASVLLPVITARTEAARANLDRLRSIAVEAAEQCERLDVPELRPPAPLAGLLAAWPAGRRLVVAAERAEAPPIRAKAGPCGLLVGPEGGFTPAELDVLRARAFVEAASLGPLILRAETAAVAGLALLQVPRDV